MFYEILISVILKAANNLLIIRMIHETTGVKREKAESVFLKVESYRRQIVSLRIETVLNDKL